MIQISDSNEFIAFVKTQPGKDWNVRAFWEPRGGLWLIEWSCADHALTLEPGPARRLVRDLGRQFRIGFARLPDGGRFAHLNELLRWLAAYDAKAKMALHWNREGLRPEHVGLKQPERV